MSRKNKLFGNQIRTTTGKIIDQASFKKIGLIMLVVILICSLYYYFLSPIGQGTNNHELSFLNSIFFSIVTFSSLGYGDITPEGFGKVIASIEVLLGLVLVAVFVGKVASERLSALLQLTYSSENERRLVDFAKDVHEKSNSIEIALTNHDHDKLHNISRKTFAFMSSLYKYLQFHINQGGYDSFSYMSAPRRLFKALVILQQESIEAMKTFGTETRTVNKFEKIIDTIEKISHLATPYHLNNEKTTSILKKIRDESENFRKWKVSKEKNEVTLKYRVEITDALLEKIKKELPEPPWQKNIHKQVAEKLNISNNLSEKCIIYLIENGEYPELLKKK